MPAPLVGRPYKRLEDQRLLRGEASFIDDLRLVGMLHVAFVRSIHAHARVRVASSPVMPDVIGIFTAEDLWPGGGCPDIPIVVGHEALRPCRQPALARDR